MRRRPVGRPATIRGLSAGFVLAGVRACGGGGGTGGGQGSSTVDFGGGPLGPAARRQIVACVS
jgi:hypothetical protein